jgi:two-component system CitB family response regulator
VPEDIRVLIVDDDFHIARLHAACVDAIRGFSALAPVGTGAAALRAAESLQPDLALIDVYLPDMSGLEVLRRLEFDAFIVSAASDGASIRRALARGALTYLIKPFDAALLEQRLQNYARYRSVLDPSRPADQETVERALRIMHPGDRSTAGRSRAVTELAVLEMLRARGEPVPATEVAAVVGISRATAQRYLSGLVDDGAASVQLRYGSAGRPEHRYAVRSDAGLGRRE